jgi:hypothetical protein
MGSTFKRPREDRDNLPLSNGLPEQHDVDLDEVIGLAEYMVPLGSIDFATEPSREEVEAIIEWADGDAETLRGAWALAVHRCDTHEVRRGTVELLATALHRAEERATPHEPRRVRPTPRQGTRPRIIARQLLRTKEQPDISRQ